MVILDHSMDVGTKKLLVALRVPIHQQSALSLTACECVGLHLAERVTGETIAAALTPIFQQAGLPAAILKDNDRTLHKGVMCWQQQHALDIPVVQDISHVVAASLKRQFAKTKTYQHFTQLMTQLGKALRQSAWAFLCPPKLRTKGRFLSIGKLGKWCMTCLSVIHQSTTIREKLQPFLPTLTNLRGFLQRFAETAQAVEMVMRDLKHQGLNEQSLATCHRQLDTLPDDSVKQDLTAWLEYHATLRQQHFPNVNFPVSSDIIESLFGCFKSRLERNPQADMNRSVLLIPALCGRVDEQTMLKALKHTSQHDLRIWEAEHVPYTMARKPHTFFQFSKPKIREISND